MSSFSQGVHLLIPCLDVIKINACSKLSMEFDLINVKIADVVAFNKQDKLHAKLNFMIKRRKHFLILNIPKPMSSLFFLCSVVMMSLKKLLL